MARLSVTGTKGAAGLLHSLGYRALDAKAAIELGVLHAEKVENVWAYAANAETLAIARDEMASALDQVCREWLLVPSPIATAAARKRLKRVDVDWIVAQALVRELIRRDVIGSLPLLTDDYAPYFALYSPTDRDEIDVYLATLYGWAAAGGEYMPADLPPPRRRRTIETWRERVLAHGEFLGLGRWEGGRYVAQWFRQ